MNDVGRRFHYALIVFVSVCDEVQWQISHFARFHVFKVLVI